MGGENMGGNEIIQAVTTVGFPIVMCGAMAYYVKYTTDKHREEVQKLNEQHNQEMKEVTQAINNNTIAFTKLCEKLDNSI